MTPKEILEKNVNAFYTSKNNFDIFLKTFFKIKRTTTTSTSENIKVFKLTFELYNILSDRVWN